MFFDPLPTRSTITRTIQSAAWSAVGHVPRTPTRLPQRREQDICVVRIKSYIDTPTVFVLVQNLIPGLAAVRGAENAALGVGTIGMAQCSHENNIRIVGIDDQLPDSARIL